MVDDVDNDVDQTLDNDNTEVVTERDSQSERRPSIRESLEKGFEDAKRDTEREEKREEKKRTTTKASRREVQQAVEQEVEQTEDKELPEQQATQNQPPKTWSAASKEAWSTLPEQVQAEVLKREQDMERGVNELKAKYNDIDKALAPHTDAIKRFNKTPAQAVEQLFNWFQALSQNPDQAFPALIQSYNYPPERLMQIFGIQPQQQGQPQQQQGQTEEQPNEEISPVIQQYIRGLEEKLNNLQNQVGTQIYGLQSEFANQSVAKTHEILNTWAKDKPYFEEVRELMGHLLTPDPQTGKAAIPLKDGKIDLDTAYDYAIGAHPQVRAKIAAEAASKAEADRNSKAQVEAKAREAQVAKARRTSSSINTSAPGADVGKKQGAKGKSVRDSIRDAIAELNS